MLRRKRRRSEGNGGLPIRFARCALGGGLPRRPLFVSPEHAMLIDGLLVPAAALLNGASVRRAAPGGDLAYFHLELDSHDAVLAEGVPSEIFVDDGSRHLFDNAARRRPPPALPSSARRAPTMALR